MTSQVVVHEGSGEWSAVYADGLLVRVGDHYLADEWIREHFGVTTIQSDDFLLGGDGRDSVAQTLEELEAYTRQRAELLARVAELRAEAAELEAKAQELLQ